MNQQTRPTQPSIPGVGKWVVIHIITRITEVETIKRQTWAAYGCLTARSKVVCARLSLRPIGCTLALSVTYSAAAAAVAACGAM